MILEILATVATLFFLSSVFLRPPKNGWKGLLVNGLSLQRIRYHKTVMADLITC